MVLEMCIIIYSILKYLHICPKSTYLSKIIVLHKASNKKLKDERGCWDLTWFQQVNCAVCTFETACKQSDICIVVTISMYGSLSHRHTPHAVKSDNYEHHFHREPLVWARVWSSKVCLVLKVAYTLLESWHWHLFLSYEESWNTVIKLMKCNNGAKYLQ